MSNHTVKVLKEVEWIYGKRLRAGHGISIAEIDGIETTVYVRIVGYQKALKLSFGSAGKFGYRIRFDNKLITQHPDYKNIRKYVLAAIYPKANYWKREYERFQSLKKQSNRPRVV